MFLSKIDQLIDVTSRHRLLSFIGAFAGYNQIQMAFEDEEHTAFVTDKDIYCYKVISFSLKNTNTTYQCLVNKIFKTQIRQNMKVYVDNMLVKGLQITDHVRDLEEAFITLRRYQIKLNPTKCAFGITSKKFFRFLLSQ